MPFMTVAENIWIRREPKNARSASSIIGACAARPQSCSSGSTSSIDPEIEVARLERRQPADGRDRQGGVLRFRRPHHGRADLGAHREGGRASLRDHPRPARRQGKGIVYITHKMNELFEIADEVSVFRDGRYIGTHAVRGRDARRHHPHDGRPRNHPDVPQGDGADRRCRRCRCRNLTLDGVFRDVSFDLRAGEILGVAGLVGSGRSNVAETIFGVTPATSGAISIDGKHGRRSTQPGVAMRNGMAFLTEDRKETGCFLMLDVLENMQMAVLNQRLRQAGFVDARRADRRTARS